MKLPRDIAGQELARALRVLGNQINRQTGSYLRLPTLERGEHHITIPRGFKLDEDLPVEILSASTGTNVRRRRPILDKAFKGEL
jgi:hypothetical protein